MTREEIAGWVGIITAVATPVVVFVRRIVLDRLRRRDDMRSLATRQARDDQLRLYNELAAERDRIRQERDEWQRRYLELTAKLRSKSPPPRMPRE